MNGTTMPQPPQPPYQGPQQPYGQRAVPPPPKAGLWQVPIVFWIGLGLGAVLFVVKFKIMATSYSTLGDTPTYSCSYTDLAGIIGAIAIVGCLIGGVVQRARTHQNGRLAVPFTMLFGVALLALAFVHALRGFGTIMNPCDAMPLP